MFIPLHDGVKLKYIKLQYVTISLITVNVLVWFFGSYVGGDNLVTLATLGLGYIPAVYYDYAQLAPELNIIPSVFTLLTYSFIHLDFWHLAPNMLFLWVFGDNVEDAFGHIRFIFFYFACAAAGAILHGWLMPTSQGPLVGASGAVSGVVTAYLILHPKVRVWVLVLMRFPLPLPAYIPLLLWISQQFFMLGFSGSEHVSWSAHVGGIITGAVLVVILRRPNVPLFDRQIVMPASVAISKVSDPS